jgi:dipeptidyl aminopeptidase/acylaminoacyl peptidase
MTRQTHTFKTAGDCEIRADVYSPAGGGARPGIVWIHGGALMMGSRKGIHPGQLENYLEAGCPVRHATPSYPPTLLLHGDADTDVPYEQSVMVAEQLARAGVEHELLSIDGGGHGFDGRMESPVVSRAFQRVLAFLNRHLEENNDEEEHDLSVVRP